MAASLLSLRIDPLLALRILAPQFGLQGQRLEARLPPTRALGKGHLFVVGLRLWLDIVVWLVGGLEAQRQAKGFVRLGGFADKIPTEGSESFTHMRIFFCIGYEGGILAGFETPLPGPFEAAPLVKLLRIIQRLCGESPFPGKGSKVTCLPHQYGIRASPVGRRQFPSTKIAAGLVFVHSGHDRGPTSQTQWTGRVTASEGDTVLSQLIQIGGHDLLVPPAAKCERAVVVRHQKNDIGSFAEFLASNVVDCSESYK
mgnify:CR=1 FL=1